MKYNYGKWVISYDEEDAPGGGVNISNISNDYTLHFDRVSNMVYIFRSNHIIGGLGYSDILSHISPMDF